MKPIVIKTKFSDIGRPVRDNPKRMVLISVHDLLLLVHDDKDFPKSIMLETWQRALVRVR